MIIIPKLHYRSQGNSPKEHLENIQKACSAGSELVQLNVKNVSEKKYLKIATAAREITAHFQTRFIVNEHYKIAKDIKADGVFLDKTATCPTVARKHLYTWQIIGGAANTLHDCETLISKDVDYISLGPYKITKIDNNLNQELGLKGYTVIIEELTTETPIIGIGGITTNAVTDILKTGISGISVSEAITQNFNLIRTFNELLDAPSTKEQRHSFE